MRFRRFLVLASIVLFTTHQVSDVVLAANNLPSEMRSTLAGFKRDGKTVAHVAFAHGGGWSVIDGKNGVVSRNIPQEAAQLLPRLSSEGRQLKGIAFTPQGGWSVLHGKNSFVNHRIPEEASQMLGRLAKEGRTLKCIAFTKNGGWSILADRNHFVNRKVPDEAHRMMSRLQSQNSDLKSIAFTPNGGFSLVYDNTFFNRNIPNEAHQEMMNRLRSRRDITSIAFGPNREWIVSSDPRTSSNSVSSPTTQGNSRVPQPTGDIGPVYRPGQDNVVFRAAIAALNIIYKDTDTTPQTIQPQLFPGNNGDFKVSWYRKFGPHRLSFFIASDADTVILAFRGTDSDDKANTDLNAQVDTDALKKGDLHQIGVALNGIPDLYKHPGFNGVIAHQGWVRGTNSVLPAITSELRAHNASGKTFLVTGHSLGGALSNYVTYRILNDPALSSLLARNKPHRIVTFGAPRTGAEVQACFGKSFRAKLLKLATAKSRSFGFYSAEMVGQDGRDQVTDVWEDKVKQYLKGWPVNFQRVGVPINYQTEKRNGTNWGIHDNTLYLEKATAVRGRPVPAPSGWIEFICDAGYVARFKLSYRINGTEKKHETELSLLKKRFYEVPGNASSISYRGEWLGPEILVGKKVWRKIFAKNSGAAPNKAYRVTGTIFKRNVVEEDGFVATGDKVIVLEKDNGWDVGGEMNVLDEGFYSNKGRGQAPSGGKNRSLGKWNDKVRAVYVPDSFEVFMTDDDSFQPGKRGTVKIKGPAMVNIQDLNRKLAGKVSSIEVARAGTSKFQNVVIAYEDDNGWDGHGDSWIVRVGSYSHKGRGGHSDLPVPNDEVRAVTVPAGLSVYMTDNDSFKNGKHGVVTIHGPATINIKSRNRKLPGKVSSIRVSHTR